MDTRRDGITTWVASFAKNHFFLLVCTPYVHVRLLGLVPMTKNSGRIDQATHSPSM